MFRFKKFDLQNVDEFLHLSQARPAFLATSPVYFPPPTECLPEEGTMCCVAVQAKS